MQKNIIDIDRSAPPQEIDARRWNQSENSSRLKSPWSAPWLVALREKAMAAQDISNKEVTMREFRRRFPQAPNTPDYNNTGRPHKPHASIMRTQQNSGQYRGYFRDAQTCHHHSSLNKDTYAADA